MYLLSAYPEHVDSITLFPFIHSAVVGADSGPPFTGQMPQCSYSGHFDATQEAVHQSHVTLQLAVTPTCFQPQHTCRCTFSFQFIMADLLLLECAP